MVVSTSPVHVARRGHQKFTPGDMSHLSSGRSTFRQSASFSPRSAPAMDLSSGRSTNFRQPAQLALRSAPEPAMDLSSAMGTLSLRSSSAVKTKLKGVVSWYDPKKGFGFIDARGMASQVFAHWSEIQPPEGFRSLVQGEHVEFYLHIDNGKINRRDTLSGTRRLSTRFSRRECKTLPPMSGLWASSHQMASTRATSSSTTARKVMDSLHLINLPRIFLYISSFFF